MVQFTLEFAAMKIVSLGNSASAFEPSEAGDRLGSLSNASLKKQGVSKEMISIFRNYMKQSSASHRSRAPVVSGQHPAKGNGG